ncbi:proteinase-activated receptor 2 [Geospiza fortis]|uniref:Proteinase-activated receptor 2 n=1 Tax=Geospiza fortis TaxID=48883 RepID=A0A6I9Z803_GEOFO|nr:proteinase-activated receptor 2 [Geospiza fortis]
MDTLSEENEFDNPEDQGTDESFIKFIDRLKDAIDKQIDNMEAREELLRKMAGNNANSECKKVLRTLPQDPESMIHQMVEACSKKPGKDKWRLLQDLRKISEVLEDKGPLQPGLTTEELAPLFDLLQGDNNLDSQHIITSEARNALQKVVPAISTRQAHCIDPILPFQFVVRGECLTLQNDVDSRTLLVQFRLLAEEDCAVCSGVLNQAVQKNDGSSKPKGRSFIGYKVPNANNSEELYEVDDFVAEVLTGKLTTVFIPIVYILVFIIGLPSNAMALWVFFFRTKKKHPAVIYMVNLALADLLFVVWFPLKISYHLNGNNWLFGEGLCKVFVGFFYGNMYCSILFMTCLSVQRYWVVVNPIVNSKKKSEIALGISIAIWILILLGNIPLYLVNQTAYISNLNITTCHDVLPENVSAHDMFSYFLSLAIGLFLIPAIITAVAYILMIKTLSASIIDVSTGKKRKRAIKLILVVLSMYLICFTPSNVLIIVHYSLLKAYSQSHLYVWYITALCLSALNSGIDPFIYYYISKDFRDNLKYALLCRSVRTTQRMQVSLSSSKYLKKSNSYSSNSSRTNKSTY